MAGVGATPRGPVVAEDVRDLQNRTAHDRRPLCRRLGPLGCQRRETIERARDGTDHVGGHLRVERGRIDLGMSEQNLDQTHIGVLLEQVRGKAMPLMPSAELEA
jgi:hypothetical protein